MADARIKYIKKARHHHEAITHVGADDWMWPVAQVISSIENKTNTFYTFEGGLRAEVGVVHGDRGKYLRTYADGQWNDNLLALPAMS